MRKQLSNTSRTTDSLEIRQLLTIDLVSKAAPGLAPITGNDDSLAPALSADGSKVAFASYASNLVSGDTNGRLDVFVKDLARGVTTRLSTDATGTQGNSHSYEVSMNADGTKVVFRSEANNLVSGDTNGTSDLFVKDLVTGAIIRVSTDSTGAQANSSSYEPSFCADGTKVAFTSYASNLVSGDTNGTDDVFVKDLVTGVTTRVSTSSTGAQGNSNSFDCALSGDGTKIAFRSRASNLVSGDTNETEDVFVKNLATGVITRVSTDSAGVQANSFSLQPSLSADGAEVAFYSYASNLVNGDTNGTSDVFVKNLVTGAITRVSTDSTGAQVGNQSDQPLLSADGTKVAFRSLAFNLVSGDGNSAFDVFVKDLVTGTITRASTNSAGTQANSASEQPSLSADGTRVAFQSNASNLVSGDTNLRADVFVKNISAGTTQVASTATTPQLGGNDISDAPVLSADGTKVAFYSYASNLLSGDTNGTSDIFSRDAATGAITRVSTNSSGIQGNGHSYYPSLSAEGTKIAFRSHATNLVSGDTNSSYDVFVKNLLTGVTTLISSSSAGTIGNSHSYEPSLSADGTKVAFYSYATNLVSGDTNGTYDVFMKDLVTGVTSRVSTDSAGAQADRESYGPSLSADGTKVAFYSSATNLVSGDTNGTFDVFVKDLVTGVTTRVSADAAGGQGNNRSEQPVLSVDGTKVAFRSLASNLVSGDTNGTTDVFVKDLVTGVTTRVSTDSTGAQANNESYNPSLNSDGTKIVFQSYASNLVSGDTNSLPDIFLKDLTTGVIARLSTDSSGVQGNGQSSLPALSADGTKIVFASDSSNLHPDDTTSTRDIFLVTLGSAPTDVSLTNTQIAENAGSNAVIGTLSGVDPDVGDSLTFSLPTGLTSNSRFNISGTSLRANNSFDFEGTNTYAITVRVTDQTGLHLDKQFTIQVTNVNETPTDLNLSSTAIAENNLANAVVGVFSSTDQDAGDSFTYSLVTGTGATDNNEFTISGGQLKTNSSFDYETQSSYSIRVRTTDALGEAYEKSLLIQVANLDEIPPVVSAASFLASGTVLASSTSLTVSFSEPVLAADHGTNYEIRRAGADGLLGNSDDPIVAITSATYANSTNTATLNFAGLTEDVYRLTVKDTITDQAGNALDGDANGTAGGHWRKDFVVGLPNEATTKTLLPTGRHGQAIGRFGKAVAADENYRVVGAPFADSPTHTDVGYAYVYDATSGALVATLRNPTPANNDIFGFSVAVSGNIVAVGAYSDDTTAVDSGSVYLFNAADGALLTTIANPTPAADDLFGLDVAISGNTIVVGAILDDTAGTDSGSAYVFNATTGALVTTISNPAPAGSDTFGVSVGVSGNTLVVGATGDDSTGSDSGSVYLFNATSGALIATLANPTPATADLFGQSVGISGNVAVVGAFLDDTGANDSGSAYLFDATTGALVATLNNPTPAADDNFGYSVAVSGNTVVVGAYSDNIDGEDSGKAYLFNATSGALTATLAKSIPVSFDEFGHNVAISGNSVLVGAPYDDVLENASGSVFVFDTTTGSLLTQITNPIPAENGQAGASFGYSVAVDGNYRVVGTPFGDFGSTLDVGYAYVYQADTGEPVARLNNPNPDATDYFGYNVAISGNLVVVGAFQDDLGATDSGTVYLFNAISGELLRTIANPTPAVSDYFGYRVAISGNNVVVGAFQDDTTGNDSGSAYVFNASTGNLIATLANPTPAAGDNLGNAVAVSGNVVVVGAYFDDTGATDSGTAYVFNATDGSLISTLSNPFPGTGDGFGKSVAISGDTAVIGSTDDDTTGANSGSAYVFSASTGTLLRTLANPTPAEADDFGVSVGIYGNTIVVGSNLDDTTAIDGGSTYVFNASTGALIATLVNPSPASTDLFGYAVAVSGNTIMVGAYLDDESGTNSGAAYVFDANTGDLETEMATPITAAGDSFGNNVAVSGDFVVVGAHSDDTGAQDSGVVYVSNTKTGSLIAKLSNPTPAISDLFGYSVAVSGNFVIAGAILDDTGAVDSGSVYVFDATTGALVRTILNPSPATGDHFGSTVSAAGNMVVIGANSDDAGAVNNGIAYVFDLATGTLITTLLNPTPDSGDSFGHSVGIFENTVVVGAPFDDTIASASGSAYVFNATSGALIATLANPTPATGDIFGKSVAIFGSTIAVGADEDDTGAINAGSVYLFNSATGALTTTLTNPTPVAADLFGMSVAVSGDTVVVSALLDGTATFRAGSSYIFSATTGELTATLLNPSPGSNDYFGYSVAISENVIAIAAPQDDTANSDEGAAYLFTAETNRTLVGPNGHGFNVAGASHGAGQLIQGSANAFDGLNRLQVGGVDFVPGVSSVSRLDDGNQTIVTPVVSMSGLNVTREVTVPSTGAQDFVRTQDVFSNPTGSAIAVPVRLVGNLGSDAATTVFATSDGDTIVEPTDLWLGTDDGDGVGSPAVIHLLHAGYFGIQPGSVAVTGDNVDWTFNITVNAGETNRLATYTILGTTRADAIAAVNGLVNSTGFNGEAAAFLSAGELGTIANFQFNQAPTEIQLSSASIAENSGANALVATLTTSDPNLSAGDSHLYSLISGDGSTDNLSFSIVGNELRATTSFDFETKSSYLIRIRTTDVAGASYDKSFTIQVLDLDEIAPTVSTTSFMLSGTLAVNASSLTVSFSESVLGANLASNYELRRAGADGLLGNGDDIFVTIASATYASSTNTATLNFAGLIDDVYRLTVNHTITDAAGNALDGETNGAAGGIWRKDFVAVGVQEEILTNGNFENGFAGWITSTISTGGTGTPFSPWAILSAGQSGGMHAANPQEGTKIASNGFDGGGPMLFTMYQDVAIPAGVIANLSWKDRVDWQMTSNGASTPRLYQVQVRNPGTNAVSGILHQFSTGSSPVRSSGDTNWQSHSVDVSAYAGSTIRVFFFENIPENYTGPAQIDFDAVSLKISNQLQLNSSGGFLFDVLRSSEGAGEFLQGTQEVFDGLNRLVVNGAKYAAVGSSTTSNGGRTLITSNSTQTGLTIHREVTIPNTGSQDFGRTMDMFTNPTGSAITVPIGLVGNLGSDAATTVYATSDGDLLVEPTDWWFATDDDNTAGGTPAIVHLLHGPNGLQPTSVDVIDDNIQWTYNLTVGPGETKRLASFTVLGTTRQQAIDAVNALLTTNGFGGEAAAFLTSDELLSLANFQFNSAPTDISISNNLIAENAGSDAVVGTLTFTDPNAGDTGVLSLPSGIGNNGLFNIAPDGMTLRANDSFNFEALNAYSVTVRVTDAGGLSFDKVLSIGVTDVNESPTDISLSASTVAENLPSGTVVGTLSTGDPDSGNTFTYALVAIPGNSDDASFTIIGNILKTATSFNFEVKPSYTVRIQSTDQGGLSTVKDFNITVENVTELNGIDVQLGQTQRSYVRYLDVLFDQSNDLMSMINNGRFQLTKRDLNGTSPSLISFGTPVVVGNSIRFDFGAEGLGGNRNTNVGDGYYELGVDMDGNGTFESKKYFHRLLGDLTGNGIVDSADKAQFLGRTGATAVENDVNGDGLFNLNDSSLLSRAIGRRLKGDLFRND